MHLALSILAAALYAATYALLRRHLHSDQQPPRGWPQIAFACAAGAVVHAFVLYRVMLAGEALRLGVFEAASVMSWLAVLGLLVGPLAHALKDLGLAVLPLALVTVLANAAWPARAALPVQTAIGTRVHVLLSIAAAALLMLAACQAIFLAIQERRLARRRGLGPPGILPALQVREALLFQTLTVGFFALSLSLVSGVMFVDDLLGQHLAHKTVLSIAAWVVFAVLLWGRVRHGWRGRTATRWTLGGFVLLGLAYFGTRIVLEVVLERSWHGT